MSTQVVVLEAFYQASTVESSDFRLRGHKRPSNRTVRQNRVQGEDERLFGKSKELSHSFDAVGPNASALTAGTAPRGKPFQSTADCGFQRLGFVVPVFHWQPRNEILKNLEGQSRYLSTGGTHRCGVKPGLLMSFRRLVKILKLLLDTLLASATLDKEVRQNFSIAKPNSYCCHWCFLCFFCMQRCVGFASIKDAHSRERDLLAANRIILGAFYPAMTSSVAAADHEFHLHAHPATARQAKKKIIDLCRAKREFFTKCAEMPEFLTKHARISHYVANTVKLFSFFLVHANRRIAHNCPRFISHYILITSQTSH